MLELIKHINNNSNNTVITFFDYMNRLVFRNSKYTLYFSLYKDKLERTIFSFDYENVSLLISYI